MKIILTHGKLLRFLNSHVERTPLIIKSIQIPYHYNDRIYNFIIVIFTIFISKNIATKIIINLEAIIKTQRDQVIKISITI